jgi:hypothetical protein
LHHKSGIIYVIKKSVTIIGYTQDKADN